MNIKRTILLVFILGIAALSYYLFRPLSNVPAPADFTCLDMAQGQFIHKDSLPAPSNIYGMGLTYRAHLLETSASFDPNAIPPIFKKAHHSITGKQSEVKLPSASEMTKSADRLEPGLGKLVDEQVEELSPLLDYEVELGFVLLEDISPEQLQAPGFAPKLGFFISNDLSARSLALLGEETDQRYEFWGISKSFPGFLPMSEEIWVPNEQHAHAIPCILLETLVNGEGRQSAKTQDMLYTPTEMLHFIQQKYPNTPLKAGDLVLTGTPGGVVIATPRVLVRMSNLLGMDRFAKLSLKLGAASDFLKEGDLVKVQGEGFEALETKITGKN